MEEGFDMTCHWIGKTIFRDIKDLKFREIYDILKWPPQKFAVEGEGKGNFPMEGSREMGSSNRRHAAKQAVPVGDMSRKRVFCKPFETVRNQHEVSCFFQDAHPWAHGQEPARSSMFFSRYLPMSLPKGSGISRKPHVFFKIRTYESFKTVRVFFWVEGS